MKKLNTLFWAIALSVFLNSCGGASSGESSEETASEETSAEEASSKYSMETSVGVFHDVEDVAKWKEAYNALWEAEISGQSGMDGRIVVLTNNENPNRLAVFEWTESHEAAREMFASESFKNLTDSIGVVGEIGVVYYDVKELDDQPALPYVIAISHEVTDFEAWKTDFDSHAEWRAEKGFKFEAMGTDPDNPNMVYLMFSTSDLDSAKEAMGSEDLQQKMMEAGVLGEPNVSFWNSPTPAEES